MKTLLRFKDGRVKIIKVEPNESKNGDIHVPGEIFFDGSRFEFLTIRMILTNEILEYRELSESGKVLEFRTAS